MTNAPNAFKLPALSPLHFRDARTDRMDYRMWDTNMRCEIWYTGYWTWEASENHLGGVWEASGKHLGGTWEASTVGFLPSLNKHSHKLHIEYYQYAVHGTHESFPKRLQKGWNNYPKVIKDPCWPPFLNAFRPGSLPRDALGTMLGWGP
jgi:hypothetical protein